jgi:hypothetical protein
VDLTRYNLTIGPILFGQKKGGAMEQNINTKKPLYKKWWFWVILVVVVIVGYGASQSGNNATKIGEDNLPQISSPTNEDSPQSEFKVGDIIAFDGREVTVRSAERNYQATNDLYTLPDGKELVKVFVFIENKSNDDLSYNALDFNIQDSSYVSRNYLEAMFAQADDALSSGSLPKGGKIAGSIVFEVPQNDASLVLIFSPSFWSNKQIEVRL